MPNMNGHGPKRAILYARVSTEEQARSGYSLAQQIEALREYAAREGYEVIEEVVDSGQSGASLERPGMELVRDLVATGNVSTVLAQDRDRFAREPAYHYLLRKEFEEHGTGIRSLNDRGDDSPEGELTDGILDQLAKFERAKIAERTRRGRIRKAREGKVVTPRRTKYGFRANQSGTSYEVDEGKMAIVRRVLHMIGVEGYSVHAVIVALKSEGILTPEGKRTWERASIRRMVFDDAYRPHSFEEIKRMVTAEVASTLDPTKNYGVYYYNRERVITRQIAVDTPSGRSYKKQKRRIPKDKSEWIAIPVTDSGVSKETVEAARRVLRHNKSSAKANDRFWDLSRGIFRCGYCGRAMTPHVTFSTKTGTKVYYHYYRCQQALNHPQICPRRKSYRALAVEARVWQAVSDFLKEPERVRIGLEETIHREEMFLKRDPDKKIEVWQERIALADRKRRRYQEMAAEGLISLDELRESLGELAEEKATAETEIESLLKMSERLAAMRRDKDTLLEGLIELTPKLIDALPQEERRRIYNILGLRVTSQSDTAVEVSGDLAGLAFSKLELTSWSTTGPARPASTYRT